MLSKIKKIRANNNELWMQILAIALVYNPKETKKIIKHILKNDKDINNELSRLVK